MSRSTAIGSARSNTNGGVFFARHETFHPRHGWLKKGFDAVAERPDIFILPDSHITLGVGKNMGQSIRYWCSAFKIIEPIKTAGSRSEAYRPTELGTKLLSEDGWDPWLEDPASLWLLHWNLLKKPCLATAWSVVFTELRKVEFSPEDVQSELARFRRQNELNTSESSFHKDVQCILRMYTEQLAAKPTSDENIDCPFVELRLIQKSGDPKLHQFRQGPKSNLPPDMILAAALEFIFDQSATQRTISISNLTYGNGSPGQIFKLTESAVYNAIEDASQRFSDISISDMAGVVQMSFRKDPLFLAGEVLDDYYSR